MHHSAVCVVNTEPFPSVRPPPRTSSLSVGSTLKLLELKQQLVGLFGSHLTL